MLEVMAAKVVWRVGLFTIFHEFKCATDFPHLMKTLIIPDNTDVCLHIEAKKKERTIIKTERKKRHTRRVGKDRKKQHRRTVN